MCLYEITFSPTGGTQKVAHMLAKAWNCEKVTVNLLKPVLASNMPLIKPEDFCVIALPVFGGRVPATAVERLQHIRGNGAKAVAVAVYGNRAIDDALVEMEDLLENRGFSVIAGVEAVAEHSIARQFAADRPDRADENALLAFGQQIISKMQRYDFRKPSFPGNRPYKEYGGALVPAGDDNCSGCGLCVVECPVGAIPMEASNTVDAQMCISCMRCISVCPRGARQNDPAMLKGVVDFLEPLCKDRKENKLYI